MMWGSLAKKLQLSGFLVIVTDCEKIKDSRHHRNRQKHCIYIVLLFWDCPSFQKAPAAAVHLCYSANNSTSM